MKLLFIDFNYPYLLRDNNYPVGGATVELHSWLDGLQQLGVQTGVLTWKGEKAQTGDTGRTELIESFVKGAGLPIVRLITPIFSQLYKAVKKYQPDVLVQECSGAMTGLSALVCRNLGIPFYHRIANDMDVDGRYRDRMRYHDHLLFQFGLKSAEGIICQNSYQQDQLRKNFPGKHTIILHNPFKPLQEIDRPLGFAERSYVAWLGVFQNQKNLPALLQVAQASPRIQFRIGGGVGSGLDPDSALALEQLKTCDNVHFEGYIKRVEVPRFLSRAYCLLNTSHYEGFSNTFLESFSVGTPVVTTSRIDPDTIIARNRLGRICTRHSQIPDELMEITSSPADFQAMSNRCIEFVTTHHEPAVLSEQLTQFINAGGE